MPQGSEGMRRGNPVGFWGTLGGTNGLVPQAVTVKAPPDTSSVSAAIQTGRGTNQFMFYVKSSVTATFQLQTAHVGAFTSQGIMPDPDDQTLIWCDLWYLGTSGSGNSTQIQIAGTGAFTIASIVPDFEVDWVRLVRTDSGADASVISGFECWGI